MRTVYLIRHAMPDIPLGERWCVGGETDLPLNVIGRLQAALLPFVPELCGLKDVFCSPLTRARETALPLCSEPQIVEGLEEQRMGVWDGLSFREIRERFPALYEAREKDPSIVPDGAETVAQVRERMRQALRRCLELSRGDFAVVSHRTAIESLIGHRELLKHTSISVLVFDGESFRTESIGYIPHPALTDEVCLALLETAGADSALIAHCRAVAAYADELCAALRESGVELDAAAIRSAALLHDIARSERDHAALGAVWLSELGYEKEAGLVRRHHDVGGGALDEAAVLFIADKCVRGSERVPLEARFAASAEKCRSDEARAAHARRFAAAAAVKAAVNSACGRELII